MKKQQEAPKKYDLAEVIKAELDKAPPLEIVIGDKTITVLPPSLWPDKVFEVDNTTSMKILLGDENYEAYVAAGGTTRLFFQRIVPDSQAKVV